jgi:putative transposase
VQRCQVNQRWNVKVDLPENSQGDHDRRIRNAYAMSNYAEATAELEKVFRQLEERVNPSAVGSLRDGVEETQTVHSLGLGALPRKMLISSNPIESRCQ